MATDPGTLDFLLDQLGPRRAAFTTRRMFGEYCVYRDGRPVAFVCDDVLFVKDTPAGREAIAAEAPVEFGPPYPGAKLYLRLAPDRWDDGDWLVRVLEATAAALPAPGARAPKARARSGTPNRKAGTAKAEGPAGGHTRSPGDGPD